MKERLWVMRPNPYSATTVALRLSVLAMTGGWKSERRVCEEFKILLQVAVLP